MNDLQKAYFQELQAAGFTITAPAVVQPPAAAPPAAAPPAAAVVQPDWFKPMSEMGAKLNEVITHLAAKPNTSLAATPPQPTPVGGIQPFKIDEFSGAKFISPAPEVIAPLLTLSGQHEKAALVQGKTYSPAWFEETAGEAVTKGELLALGGVAIVAGVIWAGREENFLGRWFPSLTVAGSAAAKKK